MHLSRYIESLSLGDRVALCHVGTGRIVQFGKKAYESLIIGSDAQLNLRDRLNLFREQILVTCSASVERDALVSDFQQRRLQTGPLCLTITPGYKCNCACPTCFQQLYDKSKRMNDGTIDAILQFVRNRLENNRHPAVVVWYYGGEPLLYPSVCGRISCSIRSIADSYGIPTYFQITTNGTRLSHSSSRPVLECVDHYYVSIGQSASLHNRELPYVKNGSTYPDVLKGLRVLAEYQKHITLRINVWNSAALSDDLPELTRDLVTAFGSAYPEVSFEFHERMPFGAHCTGQCQQLNNNSEKTVELADCVRRIIPRLPWHSRHFVLAGHEKLPTYRSGGCTIELCGYLKGERFFIAPNGDLFMCNITETDPRYRLGTITNPEQALRHETYQRLVQAMVTEDLVCQECRYLPLCMNRCPLAKGEKVMVRQQRKCQILRAKRVEGYIRHYVENPVITSTN